MIDAGPEPTPGLNPNACPELNQLDFLGCSFTAADVACDFDRDCTTFSFPGCACGVIPIVGVNQASTACRSAACPPNPCNLPTKGYENQTCSIDDLADTAAHCVAHRCLSSVRPVAR
jgi:hypothetical protein